MTLPDSSGETITDGAVGRAVFQSKHMEKNATREKGYTPPLVPFYRQVKVLVEISVFILDLASDGNIDKNRR